MQPLRTDDPDRIADYRLLGRLGEGGMGVVYLARSPRGRMVAVKTIRAEFAAVPDFRRRFAKETAAARQVGGRWTAEVLAADPDAALPWVATAFVAGPTLHQVVEEHGPLPEHSVRGLAAGLCRALADIHAAGLVHRDVKPSNVLVAVDGPRVIDFGIVRALNLSTTGGLTSTGMVIGSPGFMSPEQVRGERLTMASDVFSLGTVLAFAATGRLPFHAEEGQPHALMYRMVHEPPDLTGVPESLRDLVESCLVKDPAGRPTAALLRDRADAPAEAHGPWLPPEVLARLGEEAARLLAWEDPHPRVDSTADTSPGAARAAADAATRPGPPVAAPTAPITTAAVGPPRPAPAEESAPAGREPGPPRRLLVDERRAAPGSSPADVPRRVLYVLLALFTVVSLVNGLHLLTGLAEEGRSEAVDRYGDLWAIDQEETTHVLLVLKVGVAVGLLVCWLIWCYQTRVTAERFAPGGLRHRPRTAVTSWFLPVGNLFVPKQIANDVWHASSAPRPGGGMAPAGPLHAWWALWLATFLTWPLFWTPPLETLSTHRYAYEPAGGGFRDYYYWYAFEPWTWLHLLLHLLVVPTAVVTAWYVRRLTALQAVRAGG
ncbi:protein kinase [Streptomyces sp. DSM 44915]|uniref:Protein kinase n=1 Tax=Streptomyces chisholmiae TaxID=3075540 RepID=A0ABU2JLK7_9ACTN|nr:protein kinase [Streptomyces sp. DSM 44915]MDT0265872.1 protein kinase [Streptomyces sp. DSM 44915]